MNWVVVDRCREELLLTPVHVMCTSYGMTVEYLMQQLGILCRSNILGDICVEAVEGAGDMLYWKDGPYTLALTL